VPFADRLRPLIDLREQVVSFPPQPVITRDKRAAILSAEGAKQPAILTAEGERQAAVLRVSGCSPTSTWRCCRRSPGAARTSCGSCPASSARPWQAWAGSSAATPSPVAVRSLAGELPDELPGPDGPGSFSRLPL
jgi:hypothetical protein